MAGITPGEWRILGHDVVSDRHTYAGLVAAVYSGGRQAGSDADAELNANLTAISALPDLLAACKAYDAAWTATCPDGPNIGAPRLGSSTIELWKQIRAAIAKAEGQEPK